MLIETYFKGKVRVKVGDITGELVDAIVNAANSTLLGGGGVDGAIHRAGGPAILSECRVIRDSLLPAGLPTGQAVITTAGNLPATHVIHTVGPIFGADPGRQAEMLADCYRNSIRLAIDIGLDSIAFPSISTGVYGYPKAEAAMLVSRTITEHYQSNDAPRDLRLVFFSEADARIFIQNSIFPQR